MSHTVTGTRDCVALPASRALVATLMAVAAGAWLLSARLAMPEMRLGVLTGATMTPAARWACRAPRRWA